MYFDCKNVCVLVAKLCKICLIIAKVCVLNANLSKMYAFGLQRCCAFWSSATLSLQLQKNFETLMTA